MLKQGEVKWKLSDHELQNRLHVSVNGRMPDDSPGLLQVDFANRWVGGGMLGEGCVQEEILFMLYPELIISRLFTEQLDDREFFETLVITGCERFSRSSGYASSFRFEEDYEDKSKRDEWGRRIFEIIAMDASVSFSFSPLIVLIYMQ